MKNSLMAFAGLAAIAAPAYAETTPQATSYAPEETLWELRLGGTGLWAPDYPGANEESFNWAAAPIFIYRGDRIRFGEYGMARAIATETKRFELDLSIDAAYSAESEDNDARHGMPDLDYLLQIGPQAIINFHDSGWTPRGRDEIKLRIPVRGVAATDFKAIEHAGWLAEPTLSYRHRWPGEQRMGFTASVFASFADEELQNYYYGVAPAYANINRPAYQADGGYLGLGANISATRQMHDNFQIYLTWQGRSFEGAANQDSPLHRADFTSAVSVSFVWKMLKSKRPAQNDDM